MATMTGSYGKTLLQRVLDTPVTTKPNRQEVSREELDLAFAYFGGVVTANQVEAALGLGKNSGQSRMNAYIRRGIKQGKVVIK